MDQRIVKLPKWAQEEFERVVRERDTAVKALNNYCDKQTKSPFYYNDFLCVDQPPKKYTAYVQTHTMKVEHKGVCLEIIPSDDGIILQWGGDKHYYVKDVALVPKAYQRVELIAKDNMRT